MSEPPKPKKQRIDADDDDDDDIEMEVDERQQIFRAYPTEQHLVAEYEVNWRVSSRLLPDTYQHFRRQRASKHKQVPRHFTYRNLRLRWPSDLVAMSMPDIEKRLSESNSESIFKVGTNAASAYLSHKNYLIGETHSRMVAENEWISRHGEQDMQMAITLLANLSPQDNNYLVLTNAINAARGDQASDTEIHQTIFNAYPSEVDFLATYTRHRGNWLSLFPTNYQDFARVRSSINVTAHLTYRGARIIWLASLNALSMPTIQHRL
jgi:hypothetical protein